MCNLSTGETDPCVTCRTSHLVRFASLILTDKTIARRLWAPTQVRIEVHHRIVDKAAILCEKSIVEKTLDIFFGILFFTATLHASDIRDLSFINQAFKILLRA